MTDCQITADAHARFERDAEIALAAFEQRFELRIAFESRDHVAHFGADGPVTGDIARRILAFAALLEFLKPLDKMVSAQAGVLAHFGFELQSASCRQGPVPITRSGLGRKLGVLLVNGLGTWEP